MRVCSSCGKKIGIFKSTYQCSEEGCNKEFCDDCETKIQTCNKCDNDYCGQHIHNHTCETEQEEEEEEEEKEDDNKQIIEYLNNLSERQLLILLVYDKIKNSGDLSLDDLKAINKDDGLITLFGD